MVMLGYPTASIFDKEDHAAMTVLNAVMSGYSYPGGWLHNELRGEGLVYYVQAIADDRARAGLLRHRRPDPARQGRRSGRADRAATSSGPRGARSARTSSARPSSRSIALHAQENTTIAEQARRRPSTSSTAWATTTTRRSTPGSGRSSSQDVVGRRPQVLRQPRAGHVVAGKPSW